MLICKECGNDANLFRDDVKGMVICEVHQKIVSNHCIENQVEFIGTTGKAHGTLMPSYGGYQKGKSSRVD